MFAAPLIWLSNNQWNFAWFWRVRNVKIEFFWRIVFVSNEKLRQRKWEWSCFSLTNPSKRFIQIYIETRRRSSRTMCLSVENACPAQQHAYIFLLKISMLSRSIRSRNRRVARCGGKGSPRYLIRQLNSVPLHFIFVRVNHHHPYCVCSWRIRCQKA